MNGDKTNENTIDMIMRHHHMVSEVTIGQRIRDARKEKGLTQKKLGELCGMSDAQIRQYEIGYRNPSYKTLNKIADALGVNKGDLIFGDSDYKYGDPEFARILDDLANTLGESGKADSNPQWIYEALEWFEAKEKMDWAYYDWDIDINSSDPISNDEGNIREAIQALVFYFLKLNPIGRTKLFERIKELNELPKYTKKEE